MRAQTDFKSAITPILVIETYIEAFLFQKSYTNDCIRKGTLIGDENPITILGGKPIPPVYFPLPGSTTMRYVLFCPSTFYYCWYLMKIKAVIFLPTTRATNNTTHIQHTTLHTAFLTPQMAASGLRNFVTSLLRHTQPLYSIRAIANVILVHRHPFQ